MARFYFDILDSRGFHQDEVGAECKDLEEALEQAQSLLPDIARDELSDSGFHIITCDVRDDLGSVVYRGELTYRGMRHPM